MTAISYYGIEGFIPLGCFSRVNVVIGNGIGVLIVNGQRSALLRVWPVGRLEQCAKVVRASIYFSP